MSRAYWTKQLQEAQQELDAAKRLSEVRKAAARLQRARAELVWLEEEKPKRRAGRGPGSDRESHG